MSAIAQRRTAAAAAIVMLLTILQYVLINVDVAPAAAHHPEVAAVSVCEEGTPYIDFDVTAWETDDTDRRHNNDVRVSIDGTEVASGAFTAENGYSFDGRIDATAYLGQTVTLRATAVVRWGVEENKGSANEYRETTVQVADSCGPTTTLPEYVPSSCPVPDEGAIAVALNLDGKISATSPSHAVAGPYPITLPAGVYDVYLTSRDSNHAESYDPSQVEEYFFVRGFFESEEVWTSPTISDLPDDEVVLTELVASGVAVPQLDAVSAVHAGYPNDIANSVESVCVVFVPQESPPERTRTRSTTPDVKSALGDLVWFDENGNGQQDNPAVEFPIHGATVTLLSPDGTVLAQQVTSTDGLYLFDELEAGNYRVEVCLPGADYTVTDALGVADDVDSDVFSLADKVGCARTGLISLPEETTDLTWDAGVVVEVKGIQVEPTTTTAPPPVEPVTVETLPFTGADTEEMALLALGAMAVGALLLFAVSKREDDMVTTADASTSWSNRRR